MGVTCQVSYPLPVLTIVSGLPSVSRSSFLDRSGGTMFERRLTLLIFADWLPPDFCASRSCLTLGTDIAAEAATLNAIEDSPPGHRAADTIEERTRPGPAPTVTAAWATPPAQSPRQTPRARAR